MVWRRGKAYAQEVVAVWAYGLLEDTGRVLLDAEMDVPLVAEVHDVCPVRADVVDLHVWRVGRGKYACILGVATTATSTPPTSGSS